MYFWLISYVLTVTFHRAFLGCEHLQTLTSISHLLASLRAGAAYIGFFLLSVGFACVWHSAANFCHLLLIVLGILIHVCLLLLLWKNCSVFIVPCIVWDHLEVEFVLIFHHIAPNFLELELSVIWVAANASQVSDANLRAFRDEDFWPQVLD